MGPAFSSPFPSVGAGYADGSSVMPPFNPQGPPMMPPFASQSAYGAAPSFPGRFPPSFSQVPLGIGPVMPPSIQPPIGYNRGVPSFQAAQSFPTFVPSSGYGAVPQLPIAPQQPAIPQMPFVPPTQQYAGAQRFPQGAPASLPDFSALGGAQQFAGSSYSAPLTGMTGEIPTFGVPPAGAQQGYDSSSALTGAQLTQLGGAAAAPQLSQIGGGASQYGSSSAALTGAQFPQPGASAGPQFPQSGASDAQSSYSSSSQSIGSAPQGNFIPIFPGASSASSNPAPTGGYSSEQAPPAPASGY